MVFASTDPALVPAISLNRLVCVYSLYESFVPITIPNKPTNLLSFNVFKPSSGPTNSVCVCVGRGHIIVTVEKNPSQSALNMMSLLMNDSFFHIHKNNLQYLSFNL